jgi:Fe2+ transport system protein FeoA
MAYILLILNRLQVNEDERSRTGLTRRPHPRMLRRVQLSFKKQTAAGAVAAEESLADLRCGQSAVLDSLHVSEDLGQRLMELGFFPGGTIVATGCAPGGDPRIYRVDGSEIALRKETAGKMRIKAGTVTRVETSRIGS